jgi:hypothetical protein
VDCQIVRSRVASLADFFALVDSLTSDERFWFRGHSKVSHELVPSALRYRSKPQRDAALALLGEFQRIAEHKIPRPPARHELFEWIQVAQHYGLPTRLLDWTESPTVGLFFACVGSPSDDGILFSMNPAELNALGPGKAKRILTARADAGLLKRYQALGGSSAGKRGGFALAINPIWNSERLIAQRGVFTLHGSRFALDQVQAPSLIGIPLPHEAKPFLLRQLSTVGVDRLTLFPELEHTCRYLRERVAGASP